MKIRSLMLALVGSALMAGSALAADVTFAVTAGNAPQAAFHFVKVSGGLPETKVVKKSTTVDGVSYYVWKTSLRGIAHVCGIPKGPATSAKCVGEMGTQLQVDGNFVVLQ